MADTKSRTTAPTPSPYQDEVGPNVVIRDFTGMAPNQDPHDLQPGQSVSQINCGVGPRGELRVRLGAAVVRFD